MTAVSGTVTIFATRLQHQLESPILVEDMRSRSNRPLTTLTPRSAQWQEWAPATSATPNPAQLDNIKAQLDLVLMALEALAGVGSDAMLQAAAELKLEGFTDRVSLWRMRASSPLRKGSGGRKKLDIEEARALVLISCYLAAEHQVRIRQAVALLEKLTEQGRPPHQAALLGDYLDRFQNTYQERMAEYLANGEAITPDQLTHLSLKLLIDLLFYSGPGGPRRLWMALLDRSIQRPL